MFLVMIVTLVLGIVLIVLSAKKIRTSKLHLLTLLVGITIVGAAVYLAFPK